MKISAKRFCLTAALSLAAHFSSASPARAQFFPSLTTLDADLTKAIITTAGFGFVHRPFDPATALGKNPGLELGIEATLARIPTSLAPALENAGVDSGFTEIGVIPSPKLHLRKGISDVTTFGFSFLWWQKVVLWGTDLKFTVVEPEEGVTVAWRLLYSSASVSYVTSDTWATDVLISRHLDFADPYLGIGGEYVRGWISINDGLGGNIKGDAKLGAGKAFIGLKMRPEGIGLALTLEGGYHTQTMHWLGLRFAISI